MDAFAPGFCVTLGARAGIIFFGGDVSSSRRDPGIFDAPSGERGDLLVHCADEAPLTLTFSPEAGARG